MMLMLLDDGMIEVFHSPDDPPNWIEAIDVENGEYRFCDAHGPRYVGKITRPVGWFARGRFKLCPEGNPDVNNALELISAASGIMPNKHFHDLDSLRRFVMNQNDRCNGGLGNDTRA